jgi:hypothetical protein
METSHQNEDPERPNMNTRFLTVSLTSAGLAGFLLLGTAAWSQEQAPAPPPPDAAQQRGDAPPADDARQPADDAAAPADQAGMEVMAQGPVHEAFAAPVIRAPQPTPVVAKEPPDPIPEAPPDQKPADQDAVWIPGYWAWDNTSQNYLWVSGIWRVPPPAKQWVPGYWNQADGGWQWVAGYWAAAQAANQQADQGAEQAADQANVEYLPEPPDPVAEAVPPAPNNTSFWVPGCWVWRSTAFMWRPGFYVPFRSGWVWISAGYVWSPSGWIFVDGYWDRPFRTRGLLFAPVLFRRPLWAAPNWTYTPSYVVYDNFLMGSLFVRLATDHYYFGDYFGRRYVDAGFIPWVDFRIGGRVYDPIFNYYRWQYRDNPRWVRDLNAVYAGRQAGRIPAPPRTFVQQQTLIRNITRNNTTVNNTNINYITALAPLNQVNRQTNFVKLQRINSTQIRQIQNHVRQFRQVAQQRVRTESRLAAQVRPGEGPTRPQTARLPLARPPATTVGQRTQQAPPPLPQAPRPQARAPRPATGGNPREQPGTRPGRPGEEVPRSGTRPGQSGPGDEPRPRPGTPREERPRPGADRPPVERPPQKPQPRPQPDAGRQPPERPRPDAGRLPPEQPRPRPDARPREPQPAPRQERPAPPRPAPQPSRPEPRPAATQSSPPPRQPTPPPRPPQKDQKDRKDK